MSLFPKTAADWTRSLAFPLFAGCLALVLVVCFVTGGRSPLRQVYDPLSRMLFGSGLALGLICVFGRGLDPDFKWCALLLAGGCTLGAVFLVPFVVE